MSGGSLPSEKFLMLRTQRNKDKILYNNYFYVIDYATELHKVWRCENRKCKGRLVTTPLDCIANIEEKGIHCHINSEEEIKKATFLNKVRELSETTQYTTSKVFSVAFTSDQGGGRT